MTITSQVVRICKSVRYRVARWGGPPAFVAVWLSLRWRCRVSRRARIQWPYALKIGAGTWIGECYISANGSGILIGENCEIFDGAYLDSQNGYIQIGSGSAIGPYALVYGDGGLTIGDHCAIAGHSVLIPVNHHFARTDVPIRRQGSSGKGITIERDCWIAANCVILDGAYIEQGCVIGASSVVRGRLPRMSVAVGSPATVRRKRDGREAQLTLGQDLRH